MGRDRIEEGRTSQRGKGKKPAGNGGSGIFNYRPPTAVKELLNNGTYTLDQALSVIADRIDDGLKVTISYMPTTHAISVICRDGAEEWDKGAPVAVAHTDLRKAVTLLGYYLGEVNPDYPKTRPAISQLEFDW